MNEVLEKMFESVQDYTETNLMVTIDEHKESITPVYVVGKSRVLDLDSYEKTKNDYKHVLTLVMTKMAVDYHNARYTSSIEADNVKNIFYKYNVDLESAIVREGLNYTTELLDVLLAEMIIELPFTYANALFVNDKDYEEFLEDKLPVYEPFIIFLNAE